MKRRMRNSKLIAEINITPFTDVVLVLLIIFMIATPFIYQSSMKVQLPRASKSEETSRDIIITISAQGDVFLEETKVDFETLKYRLMALMKRKSNASVIVNGDKNVRYNSVIQVMDVLTQSGVKNPGLGIELKSEKTTK
jgi:biopolymer transport protein TolR